MDIATLQLQQHLKQYHASLTGARKTVFHALLDREAMSMNELVELTAGQLDRATVYRTVELFVEIGIIQRLPIGWKYKIELTDTFNHHHHHLTCGRCGTVIPLAEDETLESRLSELAQLYQFKADSHQIEIRGLCLTCQKATRD
ncbi:MAG TPA: transcriptional repressor [Candidatus Saccharimonadales bacterium]|nr:transcriptional repressor [Candidatus Saccharimonadales bacterium]